MQEYPGNVFIEIAAALTNGQNKITLTAKQMRQIVDIHDQIVAAKNALVTENYELLKKLSN